MNHIKYLIRLYLTGLCARYLLGEKSTPEIIYRVTDTSTVHVSPATGTKYIKPGRITKEMVIRANAIQQMSPVEQAAFRKR